jgi:hypothetical protein
MLGTRWIEPTRRNQVKITSGQKFADHNYGIFSLVLYDKKVQKLRTTIIGSRSANLQFKAVFS